MSKVSNPEVVSDQDDEMLVEYDFSNGVRGNITIVLLCRHFQGFSFLRTPAVKKRLFS